MGLSGRVVEIGCGQGSAFEHYGPEVEAVLAVEPDPTARVAARERAVEAAVPIEVAEGLAERLPAADGELRVYEHLRSPYAPFRAVQHAVDSLFWTRSLGGCRTTRDTEAAIQAAGFEFDWIERRFQSSSLLTITAAPHILGVARLT